MRRLICRLIGHYWIWDGYEGRRCTRCKAWRPEWPH